jgi:hypothetical protein
VKSDLKEKKLNANFSEEIPLEDTFQDRPEKFSNQHLSFL